MFKTIAGSLFRRPKPSATHDNPNRPDFYMGDTQQPSSLEEQLGAAQAALTPGTNTPIPDPIFDFNKAEMVVAYVGENMDAELKALKRRRLNAEVLEGGVLIKVRLAGPGEATRMYVYLADNGVLRNMSADELNLYRDLILYAHSTDTPE